MKKGKCKFQSKKSETNLNDLISKLRNKKLRLEYLDFGFVSSFDIRISDFQSDTLERH